VGAGARLPGTQLRPGEPDVGLSDLAVLPGPPLRFDDAATAGGRESHLPPPTLGQHNVTVRAWFDGLDGLLAVERGATAP
jgi:hypothetical protein